MQSFNKSRNFLFPQDSPLFLPTRRDYFTEQRWHFLTVSFLNAMRIQSNIPVKSGERKVRSLNFGHGARWCFDVGQRRGGDAPMVVEPSMANMVPQK